jgi:hypothetical protein
MVRGFVTSPFPMKFGRHFILLGAVALAGCGAAAVGSGSPSDSVRQYHAAIAAGDGAKACAQLDDTAKAQLRNAVQGAVRGSCEKTVDLLAAFWDDNTKTALKNAKIDISHQDKNGAIASFNPPLGVGGGAARQSYELKRSGGAWKIHLLDLSGN